MGNLLQRGYVELLSESSWKVINKEMQIRFSSNLKLGL